MLNLLSKIRQIQRLNEQELKYNITETASWHYKYRDSAYIYISGFPPILIPFKLSTANIVLL